MKFLQQLGFVTLISLIPNSAYAQIVPDSTVGTQVTPNVNINGVLSDRITNGRIRGNNLFHSFSEFNIDSGRAAYFSNPVDVTNIFTRVTGRNLSNINGTLGVLGNANLFFLNPNGIVFGADAQLAVSGSFIGTTASAVKLANGDIFSTNPSSTIPGQILNVNPDALLFNQIATASIINRSTANGFGLGVLPGKSLVLAGGELQFDGGKITAPAARVELTAVNHGTVQINTNNNNLELSVPNDALFGNISLSKNAGVFVGATIGGNIAINGHDVNLTEQSTIVTGVFGVGTTSSPSGNIDINAAGKVQLDNSNIANIVPVGSVGFAGNININALELNLDNGGQVSSVLFGQGLAGEVNINAQETVAINGGKPGGSSNYDDRSNIGSVMAFDGFGNAGNVNITTRNLIITDGAFISTATQGLGNAGNININAREALIVDGVAKNGAISFAVSGATFESVGNAGNISISTKKLAVTNGGFLGTSIQGQGDSGGDLRINAIDSVTIDGIGSNKVNSIVATTVSRTAKGNGGNIDITTGLLSLTNAGTVNARTQGEGKGGNIAITAERLLASSGGQIFATSFGKGNAGNITVNAKDITFTGSDPSYFQRVAAVGNNFFGEDIRGGGAASGLYANTSDTSTGIGGNLQVVAKELNISDAAQINVSSLGQGAGNLRIQASVIRLNTKASLQAENRTGSQGNIFLDANNISLRGGSSITTNATGIATGGNITMNSDTLVALENSRITANAIGGKGGNININTQGIFRSPQSSITATGNVNGTVNITTPDIKQDNSLKEQASNFINAEQVVANSCLTNRNIQSGKFTVTGNGGIPETPDNRSIVYEVMQVQSVGTLDKISLRKQRGNTHAWKLGNSIIEAKELRFTPDGRMVLWATTDNDNVQNAQSLVCR